MPSLAFPLVAVLFAAPAPASEPPMIAAARAFVATFEGAPRAQAALAFDSPDRFDWHYVPRRRAGVTLKQMTDAQRQAAMALLQASLSAPGFEKAETIRKLEHVLRALQGDFRDADLYYFAVFGEPSATGAWGWRYEGHHLSLHFTVLDGKVVATTPQFFGADPADVHDGPQKGTRALAHEEDRARALVQSLTPAQRRVAIVSDSAPSDILTRASRQAERQEDAGIPWGQLDRKQQAELLALIETHASAQRPEAAEQRLARARAEQDAVRFAWMGGLDKGQGHYYRIQGRTFLIEYDNTQDRANHIHTVWRDFDGDWGRDVLAEHYRHGHHGGKK